MGENFKKVSILRCECYGRERVYAAVKKSVELLGGLGQFISPGENVFLKFNMLMGSAPETCVSTHPDVVYAVARLLKEHGCQVVMGDSPGSGLMYTESVLRQSYAASGFDKVSEELDLPLNYDTRYERVTAPPGKPMRQFSIIKPAIDADSIVVVSKLKTHSLTYLSGAAKNIFGVVPGLDKPTYHAKFRKPDDFGRIMVDLNELMEPRLQIMDAVMGMEGDGPFSGAPRKIGAVLASGDYSAIDAVTAKLMSMDPGKIPTISAAIERGYLRHDFSDIVTVGDSLESMICGDFKRPITYDAPHVKSSNGDRFQSFASSITPHILADTCVGCMKCMRSCPVKAITAVGRKPSINYEKCIRCYCCHEMCDEHAIVLERSR